MTHIQVSEAQSWLESTKTNLGAALDPGMEDAIASQVLSRVSLSYDVTGWVDDTTTPKLVRTVIAMKYAAWYYQRAYSEDGSGMNEYALLLNAQAETLMEGIVTGANDLPEVEGEGGPVGNQLPSYYPTDNAVDEWGNCESPRFTMGKVF